MSILKKLSANPFRESNAEEHIFTGIFNDLPVIVKKGKFAIAEEFNLLRNIESERFPKAFKIISEDEYFYLIMENIPGLSLKNLIQLDQQWRSKPQDKNNSLYLLNQIIGCFKILHHSGFLYRDLNFEHLIIDPEKGIRMINFSKCLKADASGHFKNLNNASVWQTMAPEEFLQGINLSPSSNIFSIGVLFFQLLFGYSPFDVRRFYQEEDQWTIKNQFDLHLHFSRDFIENLNTTEKIKQILRKCLSADRNKRFQTIEELEQELSLTENQMF